MLLRINGINQFITMVDWFFRPKKAQNAPEAYKSNFKKFYYLFGLYYYFCTVM